MLVRFLDWGTKFSCLVVIALVSYLVFDRQPPVENITYDYEIRHEQLHVTWHQGIINRSCAGVARRTFSTESNGIQYVVALPSIHFDEIADNTEYPVYDSKWGVVVPLIHLDEQVKWDYNVSVDYTCNFIQEAIPFTVEWPTVSFTLN